MHKIKIDKLSLAVFIIGLSLMNINMFFAITTNSLAGYIVSIFLFVALIYSKWVDERLISLIKKRR